MAKRPSFEIRKSIMVSIQKVPLTYSEIERKLSTSYTTIKNNCKELEFYGQVEIKKIEEHPENGRPSFEVSITAQGYASLKKLKK